MNFKRFSLLLLVLMLISLTAVSAADNITDDMIINAVDDDTQTDDVLSADVSGNTDVDIQNAINNAQAGEVINLGTNKAYNINNTITVDKKITLKGENVNMTLKSGSLIFSLERTSEVTISGINFINPVELPKYGGPTMEGQAINAINSKNILIDSCKFLNFSMGIQLTSSEYSTIKNSWFNGATTSVSGMAGMGTKAIQLMGSNNVNVLNNTFYGQIYDSLSIASNSKNIVIENNQFINNTFAIFYGGASTQGGKIRNNKFITCGMINTSYYNTNLKINITGFTHDLPYIGMQKASDTIEIIGNEFIIGEKNRIIYSEAENTAHGYPSLIGDINITDNIVKKVDSSVNDETLIFYQLKVVTSLAVDTIGDINIKRNNFTDVPGILKFDLNFNKIQVDESGDIVIPKSKVATKLSIVSVEDGKVVVELADIKGKEVVGEKVFYTVNGGSTKNAKTDEYGHIYITGLSNLVELEVEYYGSSLYSVSDLSSRILVNPSEIATKVTASPLSVSASKAKSTVYKSTLTDVNGKVLANKEISITFNGKVYSAKSDSKGVVNFNLPIQTAGKHLITVAFTGDASYKGSVATSTISINKEATKLTVAKKTFKKSATKKVTATLKVGSKALKGKKLTLKVSGKTFKATTNAKGVATFKVKLTKKGTFKATTSFAGDAFYSAKSTTSKIVIK